MNKVDKVIVKLMSTYDDKGHEIPDSRPMMAPIKFTRPMTLRDQIRSMVRYEASRVALREGMETFEEADDFAVGDEPELYSPYELADEQANASLKDFIEEHPAKAAASVADPPDPADPVDPKGKKKKPARPAKTPVPPVSEPSDDTDDQ